MHGVGLSRFLPILFAVCLLPTWVSCGSTASTNLAGPSPAKCQVQVANGNGTFGAAGGNGTVTVAAARECQWTAAAQAEWISVAPPASGQGEGAVRYAVQANPRPAPRRGAIAIEGQTVEVSQEAAACRFELDRSADQQPAGGGTGTIGVSTLGECRWTAASETPWLSIVDGAEGSGDGRVRYSAAANTGDPRRGVLRVAGHSLEVLQAGPGTATPPDPAPPTPPPPPAPPPPPDEPCRYELTPGEASVAAEGGEATVRISATAGCSWSGASETPWLVVSHGASGSGGGELGYRVLPNPSADERTGTISIAGLAFRVRQAGAAPVPPPAPDCRIEIDPASRSVDAAGGTGSVRVQTADGCAWSATSQVTWMTITADSTASGAGTVEYTVAENISETPRTGTLIIQGQTFTIDQAAAAAVPLEVSLTGDVSGVSGTCPALVFTLQDTRVVTGEATSFRRGNCRHIVEGQRVRVTGVRQPDGSVLAVVVELDR